MKPRDISTYDFGEAGPHPAVIVSHPDRVAKAQWVHVLFCTTQRTNRPPKETEVRLNGADGVDWETLCRCDALWLIEKASLTRKRGSVTPIRRREIVDKINASMGWKLVQPIKAGFALAHTLNSIVTKSSQRSNLRPTSWRWPAFSKPREV